MNVILKLVLVLLILLVVYYSYEHNIDISEISENTNIHEDGFKIWNVKFKKNESKHNMLKKLKELSLKELGKDYVFLDYKYHLKGCSVSTFHRDITSNKTTLKTKYPTYTALIYNYNGTYFSICPKSHKTYPFTFKRPLSISGKNVGLVLFDGDLLHAGMINNIGNKRDFMQFKIVHKSDFKKLKHLNKINLYKQNDCNNSFFFDLLLRKLSYFFACFINLFNSFFIKKEKSGLKKHAQDFFSFLNFYNNN